MSDSIFDKFAFRYSNNYGMAVFPCIERGKLPLTKTGFKEATKDLDAVRAWSAKWPAANIGIATGDVSGIWVLDIDGLDGENWLIEQQARHSEIPETPEVKTGKGRHLYFKLPEGVNVPNSAGKLAPHVDVRGNGGYVIAPPSIHPDGGIYAWHETRRPVNIPFAEAPEWLISRVVKVLRPAKPEHQEVPDKRDNVENADRYVKKVLDEEFRLLATAGEGRRNDQLFKSVAAMANYVGKGGATKGMIHNLAVAGAQANGLWSEDQNECLSTIESALRTGLSNPKDIPEPKQYQPARVGLSLVGDKQESAPEWQNGLLMDKNGIIRKSFHNGLIVLDKSPQMEGVLIYNAFSDMVMLNKCPPWEDNNSDWKCRPIRDDDAIACAAWLETKEGLCLSLRPNDVHNIMLRVAKTHEIDPPREWLESLAWDGVERLSDWLPYFCNAEDNEYTRAVGRKFLISAVKRIMEPGCKADCMLILEGEQGEYKSTALRTLATWGEQCYFTDQVDDISNKDALIQIQGVSIIEFAEMDTLNKADTDHIKKFITRQIDRYRPPYGKTLVDRPRRCVFAGSVNPGGNGYLKDPTGARRFWPVAVKNIKIEILAKEIPQLWAEAFIAWKHGEKNWIDEPNLIALVTNEQASRYEEDAWTDIIERELQYVDSVTTAHLMHLLEIPKERRDRRSQLRIGSYLRHKKWISRKDYRPDGASPSTSPQRRFYAPPGHVVIDRPVVTYSAGEHDV